MARDRITEKDLQAAVDRINRIHGTPMTPYTNGKPNANNFHLSHAYGGVCLHQMSSREGCTGVRSVLCGGHVTKRELYDMMHAYIAGLDDRDQTPSAMGLHPKFTRTMMEKD